MRFDKKVVLILLGLAITVALIAAIWMPYKTTISSMDFSIHDSNGNYHYEVNEKLNFTINDSLGYNNRNVVWYMGNGDTIMRPYDVNYRYIQKGKYMVTLEVDDRYKISKYVEIISLPEAKAKDSIPKIYGVDVGYVAEELVFSSYGSGVDSWFWEFGETGTVDAYEGQVVYVYKNPGIYTVRLRTNTSKYPVTHRIQILPLFEPIEESNLDSLSLAQEDIKKRLQTIADASTRNRSAYYTNLRHIQRNYTCNNADEVVVVTNGTRYNDLYSYCQGLHHLEGKGEKTVIINEVAIDTFKCLKRINVTQSIIEQ